MPRVTERLYYTDAYLASPAAVSEIADGGRRIYLDRSAFYPASGGQPHDLGTIDDIPVLEVVDDGERVAHLLAAPLAASTVQGVVDWPRRSDHMQQHTGQHLLSAVFIELLNAETVSVHFGADNSTLDLDVGEVSPGEIADVQDRANAVTAENRPVTVSFEDATTVSGLRKPSDRAGVLRLVTIADLDKSACGGTHVRHTGEIGAILIRRVERVKKRVRVDFLCGLRAAHRARADYLALSHVAAGFSAALDDTPMLVIGSARNCATRMVRDRPASSVVPSRRISHGSRSSPGRTFTCRIRLPGGSLEALRPLANAVAAHEGAIFIGVSDEPAAILLATAALTVGASMLKGVLDVAGGRGGGSPRLAQGSLPSTEALQTALATLQAAIP